MLQPIWIGVSMDETDEELGLHRFFGAIYQGAILVHVLEPQPQGGGPICPTRASTDLTTGNFHHVVETSTLFSGFCNQWSSHVKDLLMRPHIGCCEKDAHRVPSFDNPNGDIT